MDMNDLSMMLDQARQALDGSRSVRRDAEGLLDGLSARLLALETIEQRLSIAAAALQGVPSPALSPIDDAPLVAITNLDATLANLEAAVDTASPHGALATLEQGIVEVTEILDQAAADIADDIDEIFERVWEAVRTFDERGTEAASQVDAIGEDVREWMETRKEEIEGTTQELSSLLDDYQTAADVVTDDLIETVTTTYLTDVLETVDGVGTELVDALGLLGQQGDERIGQIKDTLHDLTQQLDAIVNLIEPVKPVLDTASAIA